MGTAVEELFYELDFKWDKGTFDKFNKSLGKSIAGFAKLGAALSAAQAAAFAIAKSTADQNDQLAKLSERLNTTSQDYQKLTFLAKDYGASNEDVTSSLAALTQAQEDVLRGKGDLEAFGRLGINPADFENSADLLLAISDRVKTIGSRSEKINLLKRIGVSLNLLQALDKGSDHIRAMGDEFEALGGIVSEDQKKAAGEFQAVWLRANTIMGGIANKIGTNLLKSTNKFLEKFNKFALKNVKQITDGFNKFFDAVDKAASYLFQVLERIFDLVQRIINLMGGLENAVIAASVAFTVLKRRMLLAFAIPLVAATALFLVIEDIVSAFEGKDSIFGDAVKVLGDMEKKTLEIAENLTGSDLGKTKAVSILPNIYQSSFESLLGWARPSPQAQAITNNGGDKNATVNITVNGADGDVIDQINTFFSTQSNRIFGE